MLTLLTLLSTGSSVLIMDEREMYSSYVDNHYLHHLAASQPLLHFAAELIRRIDSKKKKPLLQ